MTVVNVELRDSLYEKIKELGEKEGYTVEQFLASAAGEKLSAILFDELQNRKPERDTRAGFDRVMQAIPDAEPENPLDRIDD